MRFKFQIADNVFLKTSGEVGHIIGRAEYDHCDNSYLVRYKAADGRCVETWWTETAIELI